MIYGAFKSLGGESEKQFSGRAKWTIPNHTAHTRKNGEIHQSSYTTGKNASPYENKDETALFDEKTSNRPGHKQRQDDWENSPDFEEGFGDYRPPESTIDSDGFDWPTGEQKAPEPSPKTEQELADFAAMVRENIRTETGKHACRFSNILTFFDGDRVPASDFLTANGLAVETIDGEQRIVEVCHEVA